MPLTVVLGTAVNAVIDGHAATNGAPIPEKSTIALTSSDPTIATVPATVAVPAGGQQEFIVPVTLVASGSTTISVVVTAPDGTTFPASDSLIITPVVPGLTHVTLALVKA